MKIYKLLLVFVFCLVINLNAQSLLTEGSLDTTFGSQGFVITKPPSEATGMLLYNVLLQKDGKIVVLGNKFVQSYSRPHIVRYNSDGSIDNSFTDLTPIFNFNPFYIHSGVLQDDGKIIVAASIFSFFDNYGRKLCLLRYLSNGSLDTSFGNNGLIIADLAEFEEITSDIYPFKILTQNDGKIIVIGAKTFRHFSYVKENSQTVSFVARFDTNGAFDTSFGNAGVVTTSVLNYTYSGGGGTIQPNGKIVIFGGTRPDGSNGETYPFVIRYNTDGSIDNTFSNGLLPSYISPGAFLSSTIKSLPDGSILLSSNSKMHKLTPYGEIDNSFISQSITYNHYPISIYDFAIQNDGKIVIGGITYYLKPYGALGRYLPNGQIDTTFGNNGIIVQDGFKADFSYPKILIQDDDKIILTGTQNMNQSFLLSRYIGSSTVIVKEKKLTSPNH